MAGSAPQSDVEIRDRRRRRHSRLSPHRKRTVQTVRFSCYFKCQPLQVINSIVCGSYRNAFESKGLWDEIKLVMEQFAVPFTKLFLVSKATAASLIFPALLWKLWNKFAGFVWDTVHMEQNSRAGASLESGRSGQGEIAGGPRECIPSLFALHKNLLQPHLPGIAASFRGTAPWMDGEISKSSELR